MWNQSKQLIFTLISLQTLKLTKLEAFANNTLNFVQMMFAAFERIENIVGKNAFKTLIYQGR